MKKTKKHTTREALLRKGFDLFHRKGYHATGIQEITDAVEVSKGSFYNHFKKKERFAIELIESFGNQLAAEHVAALGDTRLKPLQRIIKLYEKKIEKVVHKEKFLKGCFLSNICQEVADNSDPIAQSVDSAFAGMRTALEDCLEEARAAGAIAAHTNTEQLAEFILNSWNGALMRVKASRNAEALDSFMKYLKSIGR